MDLLKPPFVGWIFYAASFIPTICVILGVLLKCGLLLYGALLVVVPVYMIWQNSQVTT